MGNFLCLLFSLSASGSVLVLLVALLNRLLRGKMPRSFLSCLWLLVLARFLLPVGTSWSVANRMLGALQETQTQHTPSAGTPTPLDQILGEGPLVEPGKSYVSEVPPPDKTPAQNRTMPPVASVLTVVWGLGVLACSGWRLYSYQQLNRTLIKKESPVADWELELYSSLARERGSSPALRRSELIRSPMLAGVLRPTIWLPADSLDAVELSCALRHELTHWRRHDLCCKWAAALTACVHWFNPVIWYLLRAMDRDCELSCDEIVVKELSLRDRRIYGELLLRCAAGKAPTGALYTSLKAQKQVMKERLTVVMKKNPDSKKARVLFAASAAVVILMGTVLGAYAVGRETGTGGEAALKVDLNRNGIPETIDVILLEDSVLHYQLTVTEEDEVIFTQNAYTAHVGWIALFLYWQDGQAYLLRYTPMMYQGYADYGYQLFYLAEDGSEAVVQEEWIRFDVDFGSSAHEDFDPETIDAFLTKVNDLLSGSIQLMNTDQDLIESFEWSGGLYHVPVFLRWREDLSYYDESKTILENLTAYKSAMEQIYP